MQSETIGTLAEFMGLIEQTCNDQSDVLFRGQPYERPLLPSLARERLTDDALAVERSMLEEFQRHSLPYLRVTPGTTWDWLALAQHHGLPTRLLDWSENPLTSLWFAVNRPVVDGQNGVLWILRPTEEDFPHDSEKDSLECERHMIFVPKHLSERITAQVAWFTVHRCWSGNPVFEPIGELRSEMGDIALNAAVKLPHFEGWHLIGAFPDNEPDDVGSWLLVHNGQSLLLEVPEGLAAEDVTDALRDSKVTLRYVTASHDHNDHLDPEVWDAIAEAFPHAQFLHPSGVRGDRLLSLGGEPVWLVKAPKHSLTDVVTIFRGVAMTGDIELGMLESVNDEVPTATRRSSMRRLREFQDRTGYHVHSVVSSHLNDVRVSVRWPELFEF